LYCHTNVPSSPTSCLYFQYTVHALLCFPIFFKNCPNLVFVCCMPCFSFHCFHAIILTPRRTVLPETLTRRKLLKKFPAFYGTRRFITAFTRARYMSLSSARSIQSMPPSNIWKIHFNIILPSTSGSS
jgi:hypothetical protein